MKEQFFHDSVFEKYEAFIAFYNGKNTVDFLHNSFISREEGYKERIAFNARKEMDVLFAGGRNKPTTKQVLSLIKDFLSPNFRENLIAWRNADTAIKQLQADIDLNNESAADVFRSLVCDENDSATFFRVSKYFGNKFDLVAYLFFLKNHRSYLPLRSSIFDDIFSDYAIETPKLRGNVDWETYISFIDTVKKVQGELKDRYPDIDISLLDAHSFIWILGEEKYKNFDNIQSVEVRPTTEVREKERIAICKARIGQGKYRDDMIAYWGGACAVTGCGATDILVASHAKPWKKSNTKECVDYFNGLLLAPNLDKLFDKGYITFNDDGKIIISTRLKLKDREVLGINQELKLTKVDTRHLPYLEYHRENVFKK